MDALDHRSIYVNSQTFCQLIDIGSFSAVATKLNLSQPTVSRRVSALEEELGIQLIQRNTRNFHITDAGQKYYDFFTQHDDVFKSGLQNFCNKTLDETVTIRLVMPMGICNNVITPYIPEFLQKHPKLILHIMYQAREVDLIRENYDLVILRHVPKHQTLKIKKLFQSRFNLYCSPEYIQRYGIPTSLDRINEHLLVGGISDDNTINTNTEVLNDEDILSINSGIISRCLINNIEPARKMALSGHAIIGGIDFLYKDELNSGKLVKILPKLQLSLVNFYLVKTDSFAHPMLVELAKFVEKCFEDLNHK